jgi:hypothetical protein
MKPRGIDSFGGNMMSSKNASGRLRSGGRNASAKGSSWLCGGAPRNVGYRGQTGGHLLALSLTGFAAFHVVVARRDHLSI